MSRRDYASLLQKGFRVSGFGLKVLGTLRLQVYKSMGGIYSVAGEWFLLWDL